MAHNSCNFYWCPSRELAVFVARLARSRMRTDTPSRSSYSPSALTALFTLRGLLDSLPWAAAPRCTRVSCTGLSSPSRSCSPKPLRTSTSAPSSSAKLTYCGRTATSAALGCWACEVLQWQGARSHNVKRITYHLAFARATRAFKVSLLAHRMASTALLRQSLFTLLAAPPAHRCLRLCTGHCDIPTLCSSSAPRRASHSSSSRVCDMRASSLRTGVAVRWLSFK